MKGILLFGASGPILLLSSYPTVDDPDLLMKLEAKGHDKFMAWEVPLERCHELYGFSYRDDAQDLETRRGMHVLDTNGQRILLNFPFNELTGGIVYEDGRVATIC